MTEIELALFLVVVLAEARANPEKDMIKLAVDDGVLARDAARFICEQSMKLGMERLKKMAAKEQSDAFDRMAAAVGHNPNAPKN